MVGKRLAWLSPAKLQAVSKERNHRDKVGSFPQTTLSPTPHPWLRRSRYAVAGPWGVPCLPESLACVEAGGGCWSQPTATLRVSVFGTKQGQVQLLPHLAKIRCFFAVMQVSPGTRGPKLKGAYVMGVSKLKVYRTQVFAIFYLLGLQYYPATLASICTPNCSPQQWCDHCFTQYVRVNLSGLAGEKLFWFQHYPVAPRTPARRFLCFFSWPGASFCRSVSLELALQEMFPAMAEHLQL